MAEYVRVADSADVRACQRIQHIELRDATASEKRLVTRLRAQAARIRADAIVFTSPAGQDDRIEGDAYRCGGSR